MHVQRNRQRQRSRLPAFTLVEALLVVVLISLLLTVLLPALGTAKQRARDIAGFGRHEEILRSLDRHEKGKGWLGKLR